MLRYHRYRKIGISCLSDAHVSGSKVIGRWQKSFENNPMLIANLHFIISREQRGFYKYLFASDLMNKVRSFFWIYYY